MWCHPQAHGWNDSRIPEDGAAFKGCKNLRHGLKLVEVNLQKWGKRWVIIPGHFSPCSLLPVWHTVWSSLPCVPATRWSCVQSQATVEGAFETGGQKEPLPQLFLSGTLWPYRDMYQIQKVKGLVEDRYSKTVSVRGWGVACSVCAPFTATCSRFCRKTLSQILVSSSLKWWSPNGITASH